MRYSRPQPFEEIDHTADAGVRVRAESAEQALARLVLAYAELVSGGAPAPAERSIRLSVEAGDRAAMAVDVLRELLFRFETEAAIPAEVEVLRFDPETGAELEVSCGTYDPTAHGEGLVLKAVTLHEARFESDVEGWRASVVFDV